MLAQKGLFQNMHVEQWFSFFHLIDLADWNQGKFMTQSDPKSGLCISVMHSDYTGRVKAEFVLHCFLRLMQFSNLTMFLVMIWRSRQFGLKTVLVHPWSIMKTKNWHHMCYTAMQTWMWIEDTSFYIAVASGIYEIVSLDVLVSIITSQTPSRTTPTKTKLQGIIIVTIIK